MDIIITTEILSEFFTGLQSFTKNNNAQLLSSAIKNENNIIKTSKNQIEYFEIYFKERSPEEFENYKSFITEYVDTNQIKTAKTTNSNNSEKSEICEIFNTDYDSFSFIFIKNECNLLNVIKNHVLIYNNIKKPNKDWLILELCSYRTATLTYNDFSSTVELNNIFDFCRNLKRTNEVHIIDSYFNLRSFSNLSHFKGIGKNLFCYTSSCNLSNANINLKRNDIKKYFGKNTKVRFSSDKSIIHERKIYIDLLCLESTHDFEEITLRNKNWTIYVRFCISYDYKTEKLSKYN